MQNHVKKIIRVIKSGRRKIELGNIAYIRSIRVRNFIALLVWIAIGSLCLSELMTAALDEIEYCLSFPMMLLFVQFVAFVIILSIDIVRYGWHYDNYICELRVRNIASMTLVVSSLFNLVSYFIYSITRGIAESYSEIKWPGGYIAYLIIPVAAVLNYCIFDKRSTISPYDCFMSFEILICFYIISYLAFYSWGIPSELYSFCCSMGNIPIHLLTLALGTVFIYYTDQMGLKSEHVTKSTYENMSMKNGVAEGDGNIELTICGCRDGVAPTSSKYYRYGQASNCIVLRDGDYGIVLDCGCGLVYASDYLEGCKNVDIILSDTRFPGIMGLLATPNPCPQAKIRFYGPFGNARNLVDMNEFAMRPLWPVNVIVGECISAQVNTEICLNNHYSVKFIPEDDKRNHFKVRISGAVSLCYSGALRNAQSDDFKWTNDCDILIYDSKRGWESVCGRAKDFRPPFIIITNHDTFAEDEELAAQETKAHAMADNIVFAKQLDTYVLSDRD